MKKKFIKIVEWENKIAIFNLSYVAFLGICISIFIISNIIFLQIMSIVVLFILMGLVGVDEYGIPKRKVYWKEDSY